MKKTKPGIAGIHDPQHLFRETAASRRRRIVLPHYLQEEAAKPVNQGPAVDAAHKILVRWADLESTGDLSKKETSLDDSQFEIFTPKPYFFRRCGQNHHP